MEKLRSFAESIFLQEDVFEQDKRLRALRKEIEGLKNRETCPLCRQSIDHKVILKILKTIESIQKENRENLDLIHQSRHENFLEKTRKYNEELKKQREEIKSYILKNKQKIRNAIKTEIIPNIPQNEIRLWNLAIRDVEMDEKWGITKLNDGQLIIP
jgi:type I site-specific restriction-modification system R (restriction) subunit